MKKFTIFAIASILVGQLTSTAFGGVRGSSYLTHKYRCKASLSGTRLAQSQSVTVVRTTAFQNGTPMSQAVYIETRDTSKPDWNSSANNIINLVRYPSDYNRWESGPYTVIFSSDSGTDSAKVYAGGRPAGIPCEKVPPTDQSQIYDDGMHGPAVSGH